MWYEKAKLHEHFFTRKKPQKNRLTEDSVLGVLNRHYAWNMPGVREDKGSKRVLTAAELPKLGGELHENDRQIPLQDS